MKQSTKIRDLKVTVKPMWTKIFLKFSFVALFLLVLSCKSDTAKEEKKEDTETTEKVKTNAKKRIVVFGDSLTAGYGLEDIEDAFPGVLQSTIDSLGLNYVVVNSGVSGETTAGGKNRIDWVLSDKPDIFILELGGNDGLRGVPIQESIQNLQTIIDRVESKYPDTQIILAGMQIPPNLGPEYTAAFKNVFPDLAKKNDLPLIPFLLDGVGGIAELNQADGIHPTKAGHKILADNVWDVLGPIITD